MYNSRRCLWPLDIIKTKIASLGVGATLLSLTPIAAIPVGLACLQAVESIGILYWCVAMAMVKVMVIGMTILAKSLLNPLFRSDY